MNNLVANGYAEVSTYPPDVNIKNILQNTMQKLELQIRGYGPLILMELLKEIVIILLVHNQVIRAVAIQIQIAQVVVLLIVVVPLQMNQHKVIEQFIGLVVENHTTMIEIVEHFLKVKMF